MPTINTCLADLLTAIEAQAAQYERRIATLEKELEWARSELQAPCKTNCGYSASAKLTTKEAAIYLGVSNSFLEKDRCHGIKGIEFIRVGSRAIRYRLEDLDKYLSQQSFKNTSQYNGYRAR